MRWGLTVVMALVSYPATAQVPAATLGGMKILPAGAPVRGVAGAPGSTDVYAFVTMPGEAHTFTLRSTSTKPIELLFIDAAGNIVLTKSGMGEVKLEAVASWADAYAVAVVRSDTAVPYSLQRATVVTTIERLAVAQGTGYTLDDPKVIAPARRCWVTPGTRARSTSSRLVMDLEALPGALFVRRTPKDGSPTLTTTTTFKLSEDKVEQLSRDPGGDRKSEVVFSPEKFELSLDYKFTGYLC